MKFVKTVKPEDFKVQPKTKRELIEIINQTIKEQGNNCDLNFIDTSLITDMSDLFRGLDKFNGDISKRDTSNVVNMAEMFRDAESFNQDISKWNTSRVNNMHHMFWWAMSFNQDISKWNVSKVKDMSYMFLSSKLAKSGNLPDWYKE